MNIVFVFDTGWVNEYNTFTRSCSTKQYVTVWIIFSARSIISYLKSGFA